MYNLVCLTIFWISKIYLLEAVLRSISVILLVDNVDHLTDVGPGVICLDGVEDEVAGPLDRDAALKAGHRQDGRVVTVPDNINKTRNASYNMCVY